MIINDSNLRTIYTGFNGAFTRGFEAAPSHYESVSMTTVSQTAEEEYGWLGNFPGIREWLGDRVIQSLSTYSFSIRNRDFEATVAVPRNSIEDDRIGLFTPMMEQLGREAKEHPDRLIFELIASGFTKPCYDGQYFFDAEHPVTKADGSVISVSNMQAGDEPAWYLIDNTRALRPFIYQKRRPYTFVKKDNPNDDNVFFAKEYIYGTDGRSNAGFGLWQLAFASKAPLSQVNYEAARKAMTAMRGDQGRLLGVRPTTLLVPAELEGDGRRLLKTQINTAGASNEWVESAELIVTPWLDA